MAVTLHSQAPVTIEEATAYLQDQGFPADDFDLLKMHINGITSLILQFMGRSVWKSDAADTEYVRGYGNSGIYLKNAPIQDLATVVLMPHLTNPVTLTGPGTSLANDDMWYDRNKGLVVLKERVFPDYHVAAAITYTSGYLSTDHEYAGIQLIALDALAAKWARFKGQKQGVSSETTGKTSVTYSPDDFSDSALADLKRHRRNLFA